MHDLMNRLAELMPGHFLTVDTLEKAAGTIIKLIGILLIAKIGIIVGDFVIKNIFKPREKINFDERRINTLRTLLKSALRYAAYFLVGFSMVQILLDAFGIDAKTLLAGAGIIGVALGFGAQSLVKDIVTGFFVLLENQYAVGEYITTGQYSGFVEEMGLRVTKLRDWGGELHVIPNGMLSAITNLSRGSMRAAVEIGIAYEEDIDRAIAVMGKVAQQVAEENADVIVDNPEVLGPVAFGPSEVILRVVAKTKPMEQWKIEREMRKRFKEAFDREGIHTPYPKQISIKTNQDGK